MKLLRNLFFCFILFSGCKNDNKSPQSMRDCKCPLEALQSENTDSTTSVDKSDINGNVEGKVDLTKVKAFVDVEFKGGIKYANTQSVTNTVITKFQNEFSEYNGILVNFELRRLFFCAIRNSMCKNSNYSHDELTDFDRNEIPKIQDNVFNSHANKEIETKKTHSIPIKNVSKKPDISEVTNNDPEKELEISIQLKENRGHYTTILVNGKEANLANTSTPFNPRVLVKKQLSKQTILIITNKNDTCILTSIFNNQNIPNRFAPTYK